MNLKKELPYLFIILVPFVYLGYIWEKLPQKVPMHWNSSGEIDRYGNKTELIFLLFMLPVLIYLLFLFIPKIDPKKKIEKMGKKYELLKFYMVLFMSVLAIWIIHSTYTQSMGNSNFVLMLVGLLFLILGNFFKTITPNYFVGIRTPWTLENETVWKQTHTMAGKLWFAGGLLILIFGFMLKPQIFIYLFFTVTGIITLVPIIYSYLLFKKIDHEK